MPRALEYTVDAAKALEIAQDALVRLGLSKHWTLEQHSTYLMAARPVTVTRNSETSNERIGIILNHDPICRIAAMDAIEGGDSLTEYIDRELHK